MSSTVQTIDRYLTLVNRHDVKAALACLSDSFELRFGGSDYTMGKDAMASAMGWDAGVKGRLEYSVIEADGGQVVIEGHESNDFLKLLGIVSLSFRSRFTVDNEGLVERQEHHVDWGNVTLEIAMKPLIDWASEHEPDEMAEIFTNGHPLYTEEAAQRWVAMAKRWRSSYAGEA
jgi:hypothetical protein